MNTEVFELDRPDEDIFCSSLEDKPEPVTPTMTVSLPAGFGNRAQRRMMQRMWKSDISKSVRQIRSQIGQKEQDTIRNRSYVRTESPTESN